MEQLLRQQPIPGRAMYIDMNSFFASVEQEIHPELRGKPVGVCPFVNDATCVIAASTEAKQFGIRTGTSVRDARRLCPEIILLSDNVGQYRAYHQRIMHALEQTRCRVTIKSIDEAFLVVPGDLRPDAVVLGHEIKETIADIGSQLGCSIGIASNMFLAKMGTKLHKPRGMTQIHLEDLEAYYSILRLTDLYGISWRMARRLQSLNIETPLDFYRAPHSLLKRTFGIPGENWYLRLRGYEVDERITTRRMIGHQTTLVPDPATTRKEILSVANQLCYKAAVRLRAADLTAQTVHVALRYTDRTYWTQRIRTHSPFNDSATFFDLAESLVNRWSPGKPVRLVSITSSDLLPQSAVTRPLFGDHIKESHISQALDMIEAKFGRRSIVPAVQLLSTPAADRIGFGNAGQAAKEFGFPHVS